MKPSVLFIVTSHDRKGATGKHTGMHLAEVTHVYKIMDEAGYKVDFASPRGGKAPIDNLDMSDPITQHYMQDHEFIRAIEDTAKVASIDIAHYVAVYFPGGHGVMWDMSDHRDIKALIRDHYESGGVVGAVCHGVAALSNVTLSNGDYLVDSREVSCFTNEEERQIKLDDIVPFLLETRLWERGARIRTAPPFKKHISISDRLVTGQNPASAKGVGEAMLKLTTQHGAGTRRAS